MTITRQAAVAGHFYPDQPDKLRAQVLTYLKQAHRFAFCPKAFIAPHAGYIYSGPIAASAYASLANRKHEFDRVVLIGPAHRVGFRGIATSSANSFATPLGKVTVDREIVNQLETAPYVFSFDQAHLHEHALEVHLPFLQLTLNNFKVIPLLVGDAHAELVAKVLEMIWDDDETLIVISSDLSHYLDYESALVMDKRTTKAIENLRQQDIEFEQACGRIPIQGFLIAAKQHNLHCTTVDQRNSGDTAGTKDRVVGYGAYLFN